MQGKRYVTFYGRKDKLVEISSLFHNYLTGDVLDVGCDSKILSTLLQGRFRQYTGIDLIGKPDAFVNLEDGIPFHDKSFDTVVALDVLEHCDHVHLVFEELCRVSRAYVIIGLPNMYEWHFRVMFLLGRKLSGKYGLPIDPPVDRHRWLFGLNEARNFVSLRSIKAGFRIIDEILAYYDYQRLLPKLITAIARELSPRCATIFAYHYCVVLRRV